MYCRRCGASAPTEIGQTVSEPARVEGAEGLEARRANLQRALGPAFEVRQPVGRGGFGEVWSVFDTQLSRTVAVKVLRPELSSSGEFRERFRREARAVAQLRHPGIVPIYHVGEADGFVYFIMPLVEGITLTAALRQDGGLTVSEAVRILVEAAGALSEAHIHGIVHRDLKPENFMLEGPERRVLLMDFGIAKVDGTAKEGLTETGQVLGSPEYMSPEQATGRRMDARSDIYSLGVVAYRMLAGRLPFDAETPQEVAAHHVLSPPVPLDVFVELPGRLTSAVMRCLAKSPDERWQTTGDFLAAISSAEPPTGPMATRVERLPARVPRAGRRRVLRGSGLVLLPLLVGLGALVPWWRQRLRRHEGWAAAAHGVAALYGEAGDSLRGVARAFVRGDSTGAQYLDAHEALQSQAEARVDSAFGPALDDSAQWPEASRRLVQAAAVQLAASGLDDRRFSLLPSEVPGCRLDVQPAATTARDEVPQDNCWWPLSGAPRLVSPIEYVIDFRASEPPRPDAGLGLAWCARAADCRVVFVWSANAVEWASHLPQTGRRVVQTGRPITLAVGRHRLRMRDEDGVVTVWLDGQQVLQREASREAAYLERPGSVHVVVQNMAIEFPGPDPVGVVGGRRSGIE
jgi:hypothetical protein